MAELSLDDAPRKVRDLFQKGYSAMERGNLDYAMDMFMSVLEMEPRLLRARRFMRAAEIKKKGKGNHLTHIIALLQGLPIMLSVMSSMGKKPAKALQAAEKLLRIDPLNLSFVRLYDQAACAAEMPEAAAMAIETTREHFPRDVALLERLGRLYLEINETHKARECFEELVRLRPKDQKALKALKDSAALDTMRSGGWEGAGTYRDVMKDAKEAALLEQAGKAVKAGAGTDALIADTLAKIEREPENMNYRRALADLYTRAERFDDALRVLEVALRMTGGADPELDRSVTFTRIRQYDQNIKAMEEAGDASGAQALAAEKDAFVYQTAQERVQKYPNDLQFKYDLGVLLFERGRTNEAIQQFQAAQRNPQRRVRALYYLALCFKSKQQYDIAAEQLEKAASEMHVMDDTKKDILYELGQISEAMQNVDKATTYYKQIYAIDIGYKDVAQKIERGYRS